jgi:hypothetical protein
MHYAQFSIRAFALDEGNPDLSDTFSEVLLSAAHHRNTCTLKLLDATTSRETV